MSFNQFLIALGITVLTTSIPNSIAIYFAIKLALKELKGNVETQYSQNKVN